MSPKSALKDKVEECLEASKSPHADLLSRKHE